MLTLYTQGGQGFQTREVQGILKAIGLRIRDLRRKKGYSQEAFADLCGVHRTLMELSQEASPA